MTGAWSLFKVLIEHDCGPGHGPVLAPALRSWAKRRPLACLMALSGYQVCSLTHPEIALLELILAKFTAAKYTVTKADVNLSRRKEVHLHGWIKVGQSFVLRP